MRIRKNRQLIVDGNIGDCFRACVSSLLGVPNTDKLPNIHDSEWMITWEKLLNPMGLRLTWQPKACWRDGYWIATVKSKNFEGSTHAIIMKCQEVFHDPTTTKNRYKIGDNMLGQDVVRGGHMLEVIDASKLHRLIKWQEKLNK